MRVHVRPGSRRVYPSEYPCPATLYTSTQLRSAPAKFMHADTGSEEYLIDPGWLGPGDAWSVESTARSVGRICPRFTVGVPVSLVVAVISIRCSADDQSRLREYS